MLRVIGLLKNKKSPPFIRGGQSLLEEEDFVEISLAFGYKARRFWIVSIAKTTIRLMIRNVRITIFVRPPLTSFFLIRIRNCHPGGRADNVINRPVAQNLSWISCTPGQTSVAPKPIICDPLNHKSLGGGPGSCEKENENVLLAGSISLCGLFPLAQEVTPFLFRIYNDDRQQGSHSCNKKHFHAHRIARSRRSALYREFAGKKQKCN